MLGGCETPWTIRAMDDSRRDECRNWAIVDADARGGDERT
jgi:hypothetical protein